MCLKSYISGDDGKYYEVLSLGPIGVLLEYQHQGIGGRLIAHTKEIAKKLGFKGILLCEIPTIILGKALLQQKNIKSVMQKICMLMHFMLASCVKEPFSKMGGRYYEDEIYNVDEMCVKEFDRQFSNKEIIYGTPMQKKFEMMIERVKPYQE